LTERERIQAMQMLPIEKRLEGISTEQRLAGISAEALMTYMLEAEHLEGLDTEEAKKLLALLHKKYA